MLRISDVSYRYKTRKIPTLKHLSLHVTEGEMLLLAGLQRLRQVYAH